VPAIITWRAARSGTACRIRLTRVQLRGVQAMVWPRRQRVLGGLQQVGTPAQEGRDGRVDARAGRIALQPVVGIGLHDHVDQPVAQRGAHLVGDRAVLHHVPGGHDEHAVGQAVPAHAAFLQEAVDRGLQRRRGGGQLIEEQDRGAVGSSGRSSGRYQTVRPFSWS
jgi:hypothetical protein